MNTPDKGGKISSPQDIRSYRRGVLIVVVLLALPILSYPAIGYLEGGVSGLWLMTKVVAFLLVILGLIMWSEKGSIPSTRTPK
jgi:hypothetical protein